MGEKCRNPNDCGRWATVQVEVRHLPHGTHCDSRWFCRDCLNVGFDMVDGVQRDGWCLPHGTRSEARIVAVS